MNSSEQDISKALDLSFKQGAEYGYAYAMCMLGYPIHRFYCHVQNKQALKELMVKNDYSFFFTKISKYTIMLNANKKYNN